MLLKNKIRSIIVLTCIVITSSINIYAQEQSVLNAIVDIRNREGDESAINYIITNYDVHKEPSNLNELSALLCWCMLTYNVQDYTTINIAKDEYIQVVDSSLTPLLGDDFVLDGSLIDWIPEIYYRYALRKFFAKDFVGSSQALFKIKDWFDKVPAYKESFDGYLLIMKDLAVILYRDMSDFANAIPILKECNDLIITKNQVDLTFKIDILYGLAISYQGIGKSDMAIHLMDEVLDLAKSSDDKNMIDFLTNQLEIIKARQTGVISHSNFNTDTNQLTVDQCSRLILEGRGIEALPSLLRLKNESESATYFNAVTYTSICTQIINIYNNINDLRKGELLMNDVLNHVDLATIPNEYKAPLYEASAINKYNLCRYKEAIDYLKICLSILYDKKQNNIEIAKTLSNLALCYYALQDYLSAKSYCDEACEVYEKDGMSLLNGSSIANIILNNKAMILLGINELSAAESIYRQLVENANISSDEYTLAANNLSMVYQREGRWKDSAKLLEGISSNNPNISFMIKQNLVLAYNALDDPKISLVLEQLNDLGLTTTNEFISFFARKEWANFWDYEAKQLIITNNISACHNPKLTPIAYDNLIRSKNYSLYADKLIKEVMQNAEDKNLIDDFNHLQNIYNRLAQAELSNDSISFYNERTRLLERKILTSVTNLSSKLSNHFPTWEQIQNRLEDEEAIVEFTYVPQVNDWTDLSSSIARYGAYIITKNSKRPEIVQLCEVDSLDNYIASYDIDEISIDRFYEDTVAYNLIWRDLMPYLNGIKTVYYAPTGSLNSINQGALTDNEGHRLNDRLNLKRLSSAMQILSPNDFAPSQIVLYGGIDYDTSIKDMTAHVIKHRNVTSVGELAPRGELDRGSWKYLPGTLSEVSAINKVVGRGFKTLLFSGMNANEESIKNLVFDKPSILHFATHGFYIRNNEDWNENPFGKGRNIGDNKQNSLIRTGILLSGANNVWTGKVKTVEGVDDGILTSAEISTLSLDKVELLVLSSCNSGRGYVDVIDGVYGLQRAFKQAGVKTIVMSLWSIPDAPTAILMESFYRALTKNKVSPREALQTAQKGLQDKGYTSPYYWASFVVLD